MEGWEQLKRAKSELSGWFFWFWVKQWRTTILVLVLIVLIGAFSAYRIPKESFPEINLWMVTIVTVYPWWSPEDIDSLITKKIEDKISGLDGIDSIDSTSSDSTSIVMATLENGADVDSVANKVQDEINTISFPSDANDPVVTQISTDLVWTMIFSLVLYAKDGRYDETYLKEKAIQLKKDLEWVWKIDTISLSDGSQSLAGLASKAESYDIDILLNQSKLEQLWLPLAQVVSIIKWFNVSQPLGTHTIWEKDYSFRIDWEITSIEALSQTPIPLSNGKTIPLESIATIKKVFDSDGQINVGHFENWEKNSWNLAILLNVNRKSSASVLSASTDAKKLIDEEMSKDEYEGLWYFYTSDLWDKVSKLYNDLVVNMISTLLIVFLIVRCFVWAMESFLATVSIPLAFFVTFFVLNAVWYTMNTLTNFSLIICLWIAVDTATVIIQGASEYMKQWYKPLHAVLLSVKTYKNSLISWTATTVVVFIPLMMLPWVMGKTMAIIPITIFTTLVASLIISLTWTPTIFFLTSKDKKYYKKDSENEQYLDNNLKLILEADRAWKQERTNETKSSFRDKFLDKLIIAYDKSVRATLNSKVRCALWIVSPIVLLVLTAMFVSPKLGFLLMPSYDAENISINLTSDAGQTTETLVSKTKELHEILADIPELISYTAVINWNTVSTTLNLIDHTERERTSFDIEEELTEKLVVLKQKGFDVSVATVTSSAGSMGSSSEVWIKIKAEDHVNQDILAKVARDFEEYLKTIPGTKNVTNSSKESPWQFVFELDEDKLALLWLTKTSIWPSLYLALNGMGAGSLKIDGDTHDINVKYDDFNDTVSPDTLMGTLISTTAWQIPLASIWSYTFKPAISSIVRDDWDITVTIWANLLQWVKAEGVNDLLYAYWDAYEFPVWVSYTKGWEQVENADLIESLLASVALAFIMIFGILVLQFNSYIQPLIISYSLLMWFIGATYGMLVTWNPYSMMFLIWFVALMWIIVNNAIILIDSANDNVSHWYSREDAIRESAKSRLKPILSTTLTTVIGMSTLLSNGMFAILWLTIMFWLSFGTLVTLYAIPVLYQGEQKIRIIIRRVILKPLLIFVAPVIVIWILFLLGYMFGFDVFWNIYWKSAMISLLLTTAIFLILWEFVSNSHGEPGWRQAVLHLKLAATKGRRFNKKQIVKRILIKFGLMLVPIPLALLITFLFNVFGASETIAYLAMRTSLITWYLFYFVGNIYVFWTSKYNQFIHDKITGISIIDDSIEDEDF